MSLTTVLLRDEFGTPLAAGSVNNTLSDSGHTRTVIDTANHESISGGNLVWSGSINANPSPNIRYDGIAAIDAVGVVLNVKINLDNVTQLVLVGLAPAGTTTYAGLAAFYINGSTLNTYSSPMTAVQSNVLPFSGNLAVARRAVGGFQFVNFGGGYRLVWIDSNLANAPVPIITNFGNGTGTIDYIRVAGYWLPVPINSDSFTANSVSDGFGHAETSGLGSGGGGVAWTGATWSVSGGKAINTPGLGSEKVINGGMETGNPPSNWTASNSTLSAGAERTGGVGTQSLHVENTTGGAVAFGPGITMTTGAWYAFSGWMRVVSGQGRIYLANNGDVSSTRTASSWTKYTKTFRHATGNEVVYFYNYTSNSIAEFDDISLKPLTIADLISLHTSSTPDVFLSVDLTVTAGTQAGLALNWDSTSSPANGVIAYHDGTNAKLEKCVAGAWTTVISAAVTYSANARIVVSKIGTAYRLYYNNALVGSGTISDSGVVNNTKHGLFSTDPSNTLDNYTCYASGSGGEYDSALQIVLSNERTATMSMADSLLKVPVKILSDSLSFADSALRTITKTELVQMALSSAATKNIIKVFGDGIAFTDSALRTIIKSEVVQTAIDSTATKTVIKIFSDGIAIARSQTTNYGKRIISIIRLLGNIGAN